MVFRPQRSAFNDRKANFASVNYLPLSRTRISNRIIGLELVLDLVLLGIELDIVLDLVLLDIELGILSREPPGVNLLYQCIFYHWSKSTLIV